MDKRILFLTAILLVTGCTATGNPSDSPDHKAAAPANGLNNNPVRPNGIPNDAQNISWHVIVHDRAGVVYNRTVDVKIDAASPQAPGMSIHGPYPYKIFTHTPYTHTIWFQPGITVTTTIFAITNPALTDDPNLGLVIECTVSLNGQPIDVTDQNIDPEICSATTNNVR